MCFHRPEIYCCGALKQKSPKEWEHEVSKEIQERKYQMAQVFLSIMKRHPEPLLIQVSRTAQGTI